MPKIQPKYMVLILLILSSVGFTNYHAILTEQMQKYLFLLCVGASFVYAWFKGMSLRDVEYPRIAYVTLLASMAFSAVMASSFHPQGLTTSIISVVVYVVSYFSLIVLMKLDLDNDKIMKIYIAMMLLSFFVFLANTFTMPKNIFGQPILSEDVSRGIIRIKVLFIEMIPLVVFYAINKYLLDRKKKWLVVIAIASMLIMLSVVRQIIAFTAIFGLWFYFRHISMAKKLALVAVVIGVVVFVLPQIPIYKAMIELSEDQRDENDETENIRITAWKYYTYENQTNIATAFFGNGIPAFGNSRWGRMMESETDENGCFQVDVGWAGFYWYFGIFATLALLYIFYRAWKVPKAKDQQYLDYWLVFIVLTTTISGSILYYFQILGICVCLSMVFVGCRQRKKVEEKTADEPLDAAPKSLFERRYEQIK